MIRIWYNFYSCFIVSREKHVDYDNARGEAHGKEERMDEVFIDDSQGHGDDQLVYEYACRIISPTRN